MKNKTWKIIEFTYQMVKIMILIYGLYIAREIASKL